MCTLCNLFPIQRDSKYFSFLQFLVEKMNTSGTICSYIISSPWQVALWDFCFKQFAVQFLLMSTSVFEGFLRASRDVLRYELRVCQLLCWIKAAITLAPSVKTKYRLSHLARLLLLQSTDNLFLSHLCSLSLHMYFFRCYYFATQLLILCCFLSFKESCTLNWIKDQTSMATHHCHKDSKEENTPRVCESGVWRWLIGWQPGIWPWNEFEDEPKNRHITSNISWRTRAPSMHLWLV